MDDRYALEVVIDPLLLRKKDTVFPEHTYISGQWHSTAANVEL